MFFDDLINNEYRAFCSGELSFTLERFGGINSISLLDVREFDGKMYPDRFPVPWLQRRAGGTMGHPLYSPAIQFHHAGKLYFPQKAELYPFGLKSENYSVATADKSIAFRFAGFPGEKFDMIFSAFHMVQGKYESLKNQLAVIASNIQWLPAELRGENFDSTKPFPEDGVLYERKKPFADNGDIVFEIRCKYLEIEDSQFWVVHASSPLTFKEIPNGYMAECEMTSDAFEVTFGFGKSIAEAREKALRSFEKNYSAGLSKCTPALNVKIDELPGCSEFFRHYPAYQRHLLLAETDNEAAIRAAVDKFGYFALWDHVYPSRDFLYLGESYRTRKLLRYMVKYPWVETCPWITMQLIIAVNEYLAFEDDKEFLAECMPYFKKYFEFNLRFVNQQTGLLATSMNCGVDCSNQVGLNGLFYASCLNGWWFNSLRALENFALIENDSALAEKCAQLSALAEQHYCEAFFDEKAGYLRAALKEDGSVPSLNIYQNTHTLGMDYVQGPYLYRKIVDKLAAYQAEKLYHPTGHTAVSYDSEVPCEMWKSVHMNQHLGHECKTARFGANSREAQRVMQGYLYYFERYKCAIETFNLSGCDSDQVQLANWQAFSATAAAQGFICGVAGWTKHRGGWSWIPGDCCGSEISNLDGKTFTVTGNGAYASGLYLDGKFISGTLQTPADIAVKEIRVERTAEKPAQPLLIFAPDVKVKELESDSRSLSFVVSETIHAPVLLYSPERPVLKVNGVECDFEWYSDRKQLWFDRKFAAGDRVEVTL